MKRAAVRTGDVDGFFAQAKDGHHILKKCFGVF
jgi:hypothetical protein